MGFEQKLQDIGTAAVRQETQKQTTLSSDEGYIYDSTRKMFSESSL